MQATFIHTFPHSPAQSPMLPASERLRALKAKARQAEELFKREKVRHHQAARSLEKTSRNSLLRRVEFMKAYSNKKAKIRHRDLLHEHQVMSERSNRTCSERVKRRKLEQELHHVLLQNEEE